MIPDPVDLAAALVRCPSVTPEEGGALVLLADVLERGGFACERADRGGVANLLAWAGDPGGARVFGFNGHTDVVPPGDRALWTREPFGGEVAEGYLWGRGAADMKSGVAAMAAAACAFRPRLPAGGGLLLLITGDEEGEAVDGTRALLERLEARGWRMGACLVGEPTGTEVPGDTVKIGRRGSLTAHLALRGRQGHAAYPERAVNPVPAMARLVGRLGERPLDGGTAHFGPSTLVPTAIETGNPASNVIPALCRATVNIRFNDRHTGAALAEWLRGQAEAVAAETGTEAEVAVRVSGEPFLTEPGPFTGLVARAVEAETGRRPVFSTTGGTSDARFVRAHCPVLELGLPGPTMHGADERAAVEDIRVLARIYGRVLEEFFA